MNQIFLQNIKDVYATALRVEGSNASIFMSGFISGLLFTDVITLKEYDDLMVEFNLNKG